MKSSWTGTARGWNWELDWAVGRTHYGLGRSAAGNATLGPELFILSHAVLNLMILQQ